MNFTGYTIARYNRTIERVARFKPVFAMGVLLAMGICAFATLVFVGGYSLFPAASTTDLKWLTLVWVIPVPLVAYRGLAYLGWFHARDFTFGVPHMARGRPLVIFQVTSTGVEAGTVANTIASVQYWADRSVLGYDIAVWAVLEPAGYLQNQAAFETLATKGAHVFIVPAKYRCINGSVRKNRALEYAIALRRYAGFDGANVWVYHQDDETAVGEDTLRGIDEFLWEHGDRPALGTGIIIYPQHGADYRPGVVADFNRSKDDFGVLCSLTRFDGNVSPGFHGSHYIVRSDVEASVGFDFGPEFPNVDDMVFETRVTQAFGPIVHMMRGFGYEQSPFTLRDQAKQRRRWFWGLRATLLHQPMNPARRFALGYGAFAWLSAAVALLVTPLPFFVRLGYLLPLGLWFFGLTWAMMVLGYILGYLLQVEYNPRLVPLWQTVGHGLVGGVVDSLSPWYGLLTQARGRFEVVRKDRH